METEYKALIYVYPDNEPGPVVYRPDANDGAEPVAIPVFDITPTVHYALGHVFQLPAALAARWREEQT